MKKLKIDSCNVCPFCNAETNVCLRISPHRATELFPIPDFCPLDDDFDEGVLLTSGEQVQPPAVYEIDINKKYILAMAAMPSSEVRDKIKQSIADWLKSDNPILFLYGMGDGIKLVKVE